MATPGYPQMQQGPMGPMGGMGGPPMQRPPRPARRGTSRAVPVVVSAGLAVGVFCGLLFGLGTGADAKPSSGNNTKAHQDDDSVTPVYANTPATTKLANAGSGSGSGSGGGIGSATIAMAGGSAAGSGAGAGSAMAVAPKTMKVTFKIDPEAAGSAATITVDGKPITGTSMEIPPDTKQIHVQVTAAGYHSYDAKADVGGQAGDEHTVSVPLVKRAASSGTSSPGFGGASSGGNHVPTAPPKPKTKPNTGIIDI
jgi:hypothetical protein